MAPTEQRLPLAEATAKAQEIARHLAPYCNKIEIAGSIRREVPTVGDIEIVCTPIKESSGLFADIDMLPVAGFGETLHDLAPTVVRGTINGNYQQRLLLDGTTLDLFMPRPADFGRIFTIRTGSRNFSASLAQRWSRMGFKGINGYLTRTGESCNLRGQWIEKGKVVNCETEQDFFDFLGLAYVEPRERSV